MNAEEYYRPTLHARAHNVLGLPALIRALAIVFVIVCKVHYQFSSVICLSVPLAVKIYTVYFFYFSAT
jgi:hypothetical protein